jgi:hypothetical protein
VSAAQGFAAKGEAKSKAITDAALVSLAVILGPHAQSRASFRPKLETSEAFLSSPMRKRP